MSLTKDILRTVARYYPLGYAALYEHLYEETVYGKKLNKRSLSAILSRLKKNGFLKNKNGEWSSTPQAKLFIEKPESGIKRFFKQDNIHKNIKKPKKLIVIFDVPEKKKAWREWLRTELIDFGFTFIQRSVWLGPDLPKEFIEYLNQAGLLKHVRFFQATERDLI